MFVGGEGSEKSGGLLFSGHVCVTDYLLLMSLAFPVHSRYSFALVFVKLVTYRRNFIEYRCKVAKLPLSNERVSHDN